MRYAARLLLLLCVGSFAVACDDSTSSNSDECSASKLCEAGKSCVDGHCVVEEHDVVDTSGDTLVPDTANDVPADTVPTDLTEDIPLDQPLDLIEDTSITEVSDSLGADTDADTDAADVSSTGDRCSNAFPCPSGWVCEEGLCAVDCGANARCLADTCCGTGEVCYLDACITPGLACTNSNPLACGATAPCPVGEQCDPSLAHCLPLPPNASCEFVPQSNFDPELLWHWTGSSQYPAYKHSIATPAVADINGDGVSDIIVPAVNVIPGTPTVGGILCALSGAGDCNGGPQELWCTEPVAGNFINWVVSPAVADLKGNGTLTVIAGDTINLGGQLVGGLAGYTADGTRIPGFGTDNGTPVPVRVYVGAPAVADLDGDGSAEVFFGFTVFDSDGQLLWQRTSGGGNSNFGDMTVAVDLDGDGDLEIVGGNMAYHHDGTEAWAPGVAARTLPDGWPAVADFDLDGSPEVVVVASSIVRVFTAAGELFSPNTMTIAGRGGPPTIADMNGDGVPDIAVAGSDSLSVFEVDPLAHTLSLLWTAASNDFSSNITGSSVFDFDGDGRAEVLYGDECFARVYDGPGDGVGGTTVRFEVPNTSCTGTEYPVVADVTGDGKAEFIVISNNAEGMNTACSPYATACATRFPGYVPTNGVKVYRDRNDNWVATRAIWNQHSYHVTNVCDGRDAVCTAAENRHAAIPRDEKATNVWPVGAPLNSYRVNVQAEGTFNAPDLLPRSLRAALAGCPSALTLRVNVTNLGALGVPANTPVSFYHVDESAVRHLLGVVETVQVLLPGASEVVSLELANLDTALRDVLFTVEVVVDDDGTGRSAVNECLEDNNSARLDLACSALN